MKNRMIIVLISFIITLALVVCTILIYKHVKDVDKKKKELEETIVSNHSTFMSKYEEFNSERKVYSIEVTNALLEENLENYDKWIEEIDKYTRAVENVEGVSSYLKEKCIDTKYKNQDIKNKCESFIIDYETVYNYYVKDINAFNNTIKEITKSSEKEYNGYELKYNYVDINKDGKFFGKD